MIFDSVEARKSFAADCSSPCLIGEKASPASCKVSCLEKNLNSTQGNLNDSTWRSQVNSCIRDSLWGPHVDSLPIAFCGKANHFHNVGKWLNRGSEFFKVILNMASKKCLCKTCRVDP